MRLPGLPTSKPAIIARATSEGWYSEERKGVGGTRRVYEIPERYLPRQGTPDGALVESEAVKRDSQDQQSKVAGTITPGRNVDLETVMLVDAVLEEWLQEKGLRLKPERRAGVLAVLCDYLSKGATKENLREMLKVLSA